MAGFSLFMTQILIVEITRNYKQLKCSIENNFGHDTLVYPDYLP